MKSKTYQEIARRAYILKSTLPLLKLEPVVIDGKLEIETNAQAWIQDTAKKLMHINTDDSQFEPNYNILCIALRALVIQQLKATVPRIRANILTAFLLISKKEVDARLKSYTETLLQTKTNNAPEENILIIEDLINLLSKTDNYLKILEL